MLTHPQGWQGYPILNCFLLVVGVNSSWDDQEMHARHNLTSHGLFQVKRAFIRFYGYNNAEITCAPPKKLGLVISCHFLLIWCLVHTIFWRITHGSQKRYWNGLNHTFILARLWTEANLHRSIAASMCLDVEV